MDLLGILRIKDSNGNWVSVPGLKGDTGEPFKILGIYATAAALETAVTDPEYGDVYLVGAVGAYDIYLYLTDGWHNTGRYMPKGDQGDPAPAASITSAVETWLAANVDPETGYVLDRTLSQSNAAAPADLVGDLRERIVDKTDFVKPTNWLNLEAIADGELLANGTISASTSRFYTDFIPVKQGDKMRGYRMLNPITAVYRRNICLYDEDKNVVSGGSDSSNNAAFTIPENVSYCRITFDKNILDLRPVIVNDGVAPTKYTEYFEPYEIYTEDFLTPESKEAVQKIIDKNLSTTDLANRYCCALPKTILMQTVGLPESWYYVSCVSPLVPVAINAGLIYSERQNEKIFFPNQDTLDSANGYSYIVYDLLLHEINNFVANSGYGIERKIISENLQNCSALVIGDSTVDFDTMTQYMLDYFTSKEKTLTLIGTLGSGNNRNEGRSGWKATDYLTNKKYEGTVNPFYNPTTETFDFSYYMQEQGYSAPDFVIIQLGINDLYNYSKSAIEPTWEAIKTIIDSIRTYSTTIKILLNLPTTPNSDQSQHTIFLPLYQNKIVKYNEYAQEQVRTTYNFANVRCSYCHLILDPDTDIRDNVHPTNAGFEKMAKEVINQINCWQNGV